ETVRMKQPKAWVSLVVSSKELSPKQITEFLKLQPDFTNPVEAKSKKGNFWQLNSSLPDEENLENHLWDLLKKIAPVRDELKDLHIKAEIKFYASVEFADTETNGLQLGPRLLSLIGSLGINLEIHPWKGKM
ncbi:MAG TPA: DUF4279 domain-containing protein, partial [Leptospiraceae bacterium]|nr:DUF4279 domain-containing protein [Leptospiraceae bacterium]